MTLKKAAPKDAVATALNILKLREHTAFELTQKLEQRGYGQDEIEDALAQCRAWNYLDDERAAAILARTLLRKGNGLQKIAYELKKRRVAGTIINKIMTELAADTDQQAAALALTRKKFLPETTYPEIQRQKGKIYRYLQNKGYTAEVIHEVFSGFYKGTAGSYNDIISK